jgi:hypothetical protein
MSAITKQKYAGQNNKWRRSLNRHGRNDDQSSFAQIEKFHPSEPISKGFEPAKQVTA